ncbi:MAG: substrate-binding domain-containing protein [Anaerolineae bacterium]|nr:substrate-binding domain-containing protein [Thermoflexales bacterium]MDW8407040.1 substrate-binding domain-containing protein [Anaerolineae bacterium]
MKPSERQRAIIDLLLQNGTVSLGQLVELLQVSEGTVRNDLRALQARGEVIRTHGGAVLGSARNVSTTGKPGLVETVDEHARKAILSIARRAASLVKEGDSILVAGSPITEAMVEDLLRLKTLTVLTNSIHIATALACNPAHTVILIGGQVRQSRLTLDGPTTAAALAGLRVQKAFITFDGLNEQQGFAEDDIASAQTKAAMLGCAQTVIMLGTADAIGRSALISFAHLHQAHHLITTEGAPSSALSNVLNTLRAAGVQVSLCGEHITQIYTDRPQDRKWRIGFANLTEKQEFAVTVRQSIERAAHEHGSIELLLADNQADSTVALTNAQRLLEAKIDLLIEYQQDESTNNIIMDLFRSAQIPMIAVDIPVSGATFFGADNYRAGRIAGNAAVRWIQEHWNGHVDKVVCLEQPESGPVPAARIQGQIDSLRAALSIPAHDFLHYPTRGDLEGSQRAATQALRNIPWGKRVLFIGINANSALGALAAAETLDRQRYTAVISQNASTRIRRELAARNPMLIGAVDFFPENYGPKVIQLAIDILMNRRTPPAVFTDHMLITPDNVRQMYPDESDVRYSASRSMEMLRGTTDQPRYTKDNKLATEQPIA